MKPLADLLAEIQTIESAVSAVPPTEDLSAWIDYLMMLSGYLPRSGAIVAETQYHESRAYADASEKLTGDKYEYYTQQRIRKEIEGAVAHEIYIAKLAERLNRSIVHNMESARTIISAGKEERRMNQYGGGGR